MKNSRILREFCLFFDLFRSEWDHQQEPDCCEHLPNDNAA
jgi:hypothetical protein